MTPEEHRKMHVELHKAFDELLADWITHTKCFPSQNTVLDLMNWSYEQTINPSETSNDHRC